MHQCLLLPHTRARTHTLSCHKLFKVHCNQASLFLIQKRLQDPNLSGFKSEIYMNWPEKIYAARSGNLTLALFSSPVCHLQPWNRCTRLYILSSLLSLGNVMSFCGFSYHSYDTQVIFFFAPLTLRFPVSSLHVWQMSLHQ